MGIQVYVSL